MSLKVLAMVSEPGLIECPCWQGCAKTAPALGFHTVELRLPDDTWTTLPVGLCSGCVRHLVSQVHAQEIRYWKQAYHVVLIRGLRCPEGWHEVTLWDLLWKPTEHGLELSCFRHRWFLLEVDP